MILNISNLINTEELNAKYPKLKASIRYWIDARHKNGLQASGAITKISRRIYIDEAKFLQWLKENKIN